MRFIPDRPLQSLICLLMLLAAPLACTDQETVDAEPTPTPDELATRVESRILASVQIEGRPEAAYTLAERMEFYKVPGISVAVLNDGRIEWARAYGAADVANGNPVTEHTLFQAASMSKPVAGVAALQLVEEGLVDLDTDVNEYLTTWKVPPSDAANGEPVTLRRLLTHSAGMTVHGFPGYARGEEVATTIEVLDGSGAANTAAIRVDIEPGTQHRYSGGGYTVMQQLIEDVRGEPFAEVMRTYVLDPAGMTESTYEQSLPDSLWLRATTGYRPGGEPVEGNWHTYPEMAAAGLWTTPSDLLKYVDQIQRARTGEEGLILSKEMVDQVLTPGVGGHGLGPALLVEGSLRFGHGGANEGFRGAFQGYADLGRGVAVLTNSDTGGALMEEVLLGVAAVYGWDDIAPRTIEEVPLSPEEAAGLVGHYRVENPPPDLAVEVFLGDDGPMLGVSGEPPATLVRTGPDTFVAVEPDLELHVEWDAAGQATALEGQGVRVVRVRE
jgi:CubicO group peptidase (beta-lactamase class C family)